MAQRIAIDPSWQSRLETEFAAPYMHELREYLASRKAQSAVVYPHSSNWFNAFALTPFDAVKVVILGQDPYHGAGQAHGLSFSVPDGVALPPSLLNIYKEVDSDLADGVPTLTQARKGCLIPWAAQGVFLLNSVLTVESGQAASHQGRGWETFTDNVISQLSRERENLVFLLWGSYAQKKGQVINAGRHLVLTAPHPSPLSAHRGFLGCRHFSRTNQWLIEHGMDPIDWFAVDR
ncbi:MAG: uracil-DNA glycosylase [Granulosicoccus sp.]|nr:uracil-DNA glycosylase [Granulosicoccus sp.]